MNISATGSSSSATSVSKEQTGFSALSAENFLEMMIVQLQNQDPLEPTGNDELLNQISQMRSLQSSIELSDSLKTVSSQQLLTSAASLIGRNVTGTVTASNGTAQTVSGVVDRAFVSGGDAFVGIGNSKVPVESIQFVA